MSVFVDPRMPPRYIDGVKLRKSISDISPYTPGKKVGGAIKLSSNENPLGPSPLARDRFREMAEGLHVYPDKELGELRAALSRRYGLPAEHFICGNGSDELMVLAAASYLNPGDRVLTADTTFSQYAFATKLFAGELVTAPLDKGSFDLAKMAKLLDDRTRLVFVCNPNNPTGGYITHQALSDFASRIGPDTLLVIDEAYSEYADAKDFARGYELLESFSNVLVLRTFSKIYGLAALRVGYGAASPDIIAGLERTRQPFNVNGVAQAAATAALEDNDFVRRSVETNTVGKSYFYSGLDRLHLEYMPTQGNFVCINIERSADAVFDELAARGVTVRALTSFGMPTWIRVTIGTVPQNQLFMRALAEVISPVVSGAREHD
jgi:histidinol-phosphate aminotransferase